MGVREAAGDGYRGQRAIEKRIGMPAGTSGETEGKKLPGRKPRGTSPPPRRMCVPHRTYTVCGLASVCDPHLQHTACVAMRGNGMGV